MGKRGPTRPPITTLGHALLGLLAERPRYGYELAKDMRAPIGHFWNATHGQIYPELARLVESNLATVEVLEGDVRPDRKVYTLTPAGLEAQRRWVTTFEAPEPDRDRNLLKTWSLWLADPEAALGFLRDNAAHHAAQLEHYERERTVFESELAREIERPGSPAFSRYLVLMRGIGYERERLAWCYWAMERLQAAVGAPTTPKSSKISKGKQHRD
jgi:DNA-binding PadR family transcriptional regulator